MFNAVQNDKTFNGSIKNKTRLTMWTGLQAPSSQKFLKADESICWTRLQLSSSGYGGDLACAGLA